MTKVRKPGIHSKVASVPYVFLLETQTVNYRSFFDFIFCVHSWRRIGSSFYPTVRLAYLDYID